MNIDGLDYNTQREQLVLPEYGREIQSMVDLCVGWRAVKSGKLVLKPL